MPFSKASMSAKEQEYINGSRAFVVIKKDDTRLEVIADRISFTVTGDLLVHRPDSSIIHAFYHTTWKEAFALNVLTGEPLAIESVTTPETRLRDLPTMLPLREF